MKHLLALVLVLGAGRAAAQNSPCYWSGSVTKCFPTTGIALTNQQSLRYGDSTTNYVELKAPSSVTTYSMLWPAAQGSGALVNDGSGNLTWSTSDVTVGGTVTGGHVPDVLFVASGSTLGQDDQFGWDATHHRLGIGTTSPAYQLTVDGGSLDVRDGMGVVMIRNSSDQYGPQERFLNDNVNSVGHTWVITSGQTADAVPGGFSWFDATLNKYPMFIDAHDNVTMNTSLVYTPTNDSTTTGSNQTLAHPTTLVELSSASLSSIGALSVTNVVGGHLVYLINNTGGTVTIVDNYGSAPANSAIYTGFGVNVALPNHSSAGFAYSSVDGHWYLQFSTGTGILSTRTISTTAPLAGGGDLSANRTLSISQANNTTDGYLSSTDWNTFNGKQQAITIGAIGAATTNGMTLSAGTLALSAADVTHGGALTASSQTFGGAKTFNSSITALGDVVYSATNDATTTGANQTLARPSAFVRVTNASLTSLGAIDTTGASDGSQFVLTNATGGTLTIVNNYGSAPANSAIITGYGINMPIPANGSALFVYSSTAGNWYMGGITLPNASSTVTGVLRSTDWSTFNGKQAAGNYITTLTGDVTASGPGSVAATLAATSNATLTTLSGLTTASSLATVGTITSGTWNGSVINETHGGTGQSSYAGGDMLYASTSTSLAKLAKGTTSQVLTGGTTPAWGSVPAAAMPALTGDVTTSAGAVATTMASTISGSKTWNDTQTWKYSSGGTTAGSYDSNGQWTIGPSGLLGNAQNHAFNGPVVGKALSGGNFSISSLSGSALELFSNALLDTNGGGRVSAQATISGYTRVSITSSGGTSTNNVFNIRSSDAAQTAGSTVSGGTDWFTVLANGKIGVTTTNWGTGGTAIGVSGGNLTTSPSSARYKTNIAPLSDEIDTTQIFNLTPVTFDYIAAKGGKHSFGFIAEDVFTKVPALVNTEPDADGTLKPESVSYDHLAVLALVELKKLRAEFDAYKAAHP